MSPEELLAGPRGRRLALERARDMAAGRSGDPESELLFALAQVEHLLSGPSGSTSLAFLSSTDGGRPAELPVYSVDDCARLLEELPLLPLAETDIASALRQAVDMARYWQEPDGGDLVAARPELHPGLTRMARHLLGAPFAQGFVRRLDPGDSWAVLPADEPRAVPRAGDVLQQWREAIADEEARAQRERPADPRAPFSGSWWSTPPRQLIRSTGSWAVLGPIGLWLVEDSFGWTDMTAAPVSAGPSAVFEIDGSTAWVELCARYPLEVTASRRHDWYRATGGTGRWLLPDWSRVAKDHDSVHLTIAGYLTTAGRELAVADGASTVLAGWDPDATYWLTDEVRLGEPRLWHRDDDLWHPAV